MENTAETLSDEQFEQLTKKLTRELKKQMPRDAYTYTQAAHKLGVGRNRIWLDYIKTGKLGIIRMDESWKITSYELENYL
ncbi:MAG: hypothetical protein IH852_07310 [Bacteroidetes bacterium]|nr:hypothetical protein [Bacteroidota bacterium]